MKVLKENNLTEDFITEVYFVNQTNLNNHYNKHVVGTSDGAWRMKQMSLQEYNNLADSVSSAPASPITDPSSRYVGYVANNGKSIKYDRANNIVCVYVDDDVRGHEAIALYRQSWVKFLRKANDPTNQYGRASDL